MDRRDFLKLAVFGALGVAIAPVAIQSQLLPLQPTVGKMTLQKGDVFNVGKPLGKPVLATVTGVSKNHVVTFESL